MQGRGLLAAVGMCGSPRLLTNMRPRPVPTPNTVKRSQKLREAMHSLTVRAGGPAAVSVYLLHWVPAACEACTP